MELLDLHHHAKKWITIYSTSKQRQMDIYCSAQIHGYHKMP